MDIKELETLLNMEEMLRAHGPKFANIHSAIMHQLEEAEEENKKLEEKRKKDLAEKKAAEEARKADEKAKKDEEDKSKMDYKVKGEDEEAATTPPIFPDHSGGQAPSHSGRRR